MPVDQLQWGNTPTVFGLIFITSEWRAAPHLLILQDLGGVLVCSVSAVGFLLLRLSRFDIFILFRSSIPKLDQVLHSQLVTRRLRAATEWHVQTEESYL